MILPINHTDYEVLALDLADPNDLSGGSADYAFVGHLGADADFRLNDCGESVAVPHLNRCIRARIEGGYTGKLAVVRMTYDTEATEATVWLEGS